MSALAIYIFLQAFSAFGAGFAFWKGGAAERWAAGVVVANVLIGMVVQGVLPQYEDVIRLCNDGVAAAALLFITVRYGALWMGGVMLFYAAQFTLHSYYLVTERNPHEYLHALINNVDWNGVIWCLIIGTAVAWRQRLRAGRLEAHAAP